MIIAILAAAMTLGMTIATFLSLHAESQAARSKNTLQDMAFAMSTTVHPGRTGLGRRPVWQ